MYFNGDIHNMLEQHSTGGKSTYAYYLTKYSDRPAEERHWYAPEWFWKSADHADDLIYMLGAHQITDEVAEQITSR